MVYEPGQVQELLESFISDSQVSVQDMTGTRDHYKVIIVSGNFEGKSLVQRHQMVNEALKEPLKGPIHALSIEAHTPTEWEAKNNVISKPQGIKL